MNKDIQKRFIYVNTNFVIHIAFESFQCPYSQFLAVCTITIKSCSHVSYSPDTAELLPANVINKCPKDNVRITVQAPHTCMNL